MTTKSSKAPVSDESKRIVEEQLTTTDLYNNYNSYIKSINDDNNRKKVHFKNELINDGVSLANEMVELKLFRERDNTIKIKYIKKKTKREFNDLNSLSPEEVNIIYNDLKSNHKSMLRKLIEFFL